MEHTANQTSVYKSCAPNNLAYPENQQHRQAFAVMLLSLPGPGHAAQHDNLSCRQSCRQLPASLLALVLMVTVTGCSC